jgi:WD40 repeat protein
MLINKYSRPLRILALVLIMLAVASLACTIPGVGGGEEPEEEAEADAEAYIAEEPGKEEAAPKPTKEPTQEPTEEPTEEPTPEPTEEPTPEPADYITVENAGDVVQLRSFAASPTALSAVAYSQADDMVATYGWAKIVSVWDGEDGSLINDLRGATEWGMGLEFSPDGTKIVAGSSYGFRIHVWEVSTGKMLFEVVTNIWTHRVRWSPDGSQLAVAGEGNKNLTIYDGDGGAQLNQVQPTGNDLWSAAYSPDGEYLAAGDNSGHIVVFTADGLSTVAEISAPAYEPVVDMEFSPDGQYLAAALDEGEILVYNTSDWSRFSSFMSAEMFDLSFCKDSKALVSSGGDGVIAIWDIEKGTKVFSRTMDVTVWAVSVSGDGRKFAAAMDDGTLVIMGLPEE